MKKFTTALLLLFLGIASFAQDTIHVKAFGYDALTRDTMVQFPNSTSGIERIWMSYNIRCHGGTVSQSGNNNGPNQGGCGEWDYSCNTYLWDSTRLDSVYSYTPKYSITGFNGSTFNYHNDTTYQLLQTTQKKVTVNSSNVTSHEVLNDFDFNEITLITSKNSGKSHVLYLASELQAAGLTAGELHSIGFDMVSSSSYANFMRIKLKNVTYSQLDPTNPDLTGLTEVYYQNTAFSGGIQTLQFFQPFTWDGTSNILMEISFTNSETSIFNTTEFFGTHTSGNIAMVAGSDGVAELNGQRIAMGNSAFNQVSDQITVMAWTYGGASLPKETFLFEGVDANNNRQVSTHLPWSNSSVYWDCGNDGSGYDRIEKAANIADFKGKWNHWTFTKNATTGEMKIYLNGVLWHSGTGKFKNIQLQDMVLGQSFNQGRAFDGKIDDFSVWKTALTANEIQAAMHTSNLVSHPQYNHLIAHYRFDQTQGTTVNDVSTFADNGTSDFAPNYTYDRGDQLHRKWQTTSFRPMVYFTQGIQNITVSDSIALDSVANAPHFVTEYSIVPQYGTTQNDQIVALSNNNFYQSGTYPYYNESGAQAGTRTYSTDGQIQQSELTYYRRFPSKIELMSFVTPYGNGLNMGANGKTYWFDMTDYAPVLIGNKRITIEGAGRWQEEMDIQFHFVEGTPPRPVLDIRQIWRDASENYTNINTGRVLEDRTVPLLPQADHFKIRSSITGHGQEGEFIPRNHHLNLNGGDTEFSWSVWKACGLNPVYPQGGTWIYDRAGWCPGMATDVRENKLDGLMTAGSSFGIDYYLDNATGDSRYIVNHQLVSYGAPNHTLDAAIFEVQRPSNRVEWARENPICSQPIVVIQNTGSTALTSLKITYQVRGGTSKTFNWSGNLGFMDKESVVLPVEDVVFWNTPNTEKIFDVTISEPNGGVDQYAPNNVYHSPFTSFDQYTGNLTIKYKTNNNPWENQLSVYNYSGGLVYQSGNLTANTTYEDVLSLSPGCYTMVFSDSQQDGLTFFASPAQGSGYVQFKEGNIIRKNFLSNFGKELRYQFYSSGSVGLWEGEESRFLQISPNPTMGPVQIHYAAAENVDVNWVVTNGFGKVVLSEKSRSNGGFQTEWIDLSPFDAGIYFVTVTIDQQSSMVKVVKQ